MNDPIKSNVNELRLLVDKLKTIIANEPDKRNTTELARQDELAGQLKLLQHAVKELDKSASAQIKEIEGLRILAEVSAAINTTLNLDQVLLMGMDAIIALTGAERAMVLLKNEETYEFEAKVTRNLDKGTIEESEAFKISRDVVSTVAETGEAVVTVNAQSDARFAAQESIISYNLRSILCVPLKNKGVIVGAVYTDNRVVSGVFGDADRDLLMAFADQIAIAIENSKLYAEMEKEVEDRTQAWLEATERAAAAEKLVAIGAVGSEFVHRMNNLAGTIPVRINMAKEHLQSDEPQIQKAVEQLDRIAADAHGLLQATAQIKLSTEDRAPEEVNIHELIDSAIKRVEFTRPNLTVGIQLTQNYDETIPEFIVERNRLIDTMVNIIRNGFEAMPQGGTLTIKTAFLKNPENMLLEIAISDTGVGISDEDLPKIFELFFTTKEDGLGFGLWRDKIFLEGLGGELLVQTKKGDGSTFIVRLPLNQSKQAAPGTI